MSHHHVPLRTGRARFVAILICLIAIGLIFALGSMIGELAFTASSAPARNPFGVGISEGGGAATGIAAMILEFQARFSQAMTASLSVIQSSGSGLSSLMGLGFAYGVFHAAGPGHGKAVIAAYAFSREKAIGRTIGMASAAALLQALVAIAIVMVLAVIINVTAPTMRYATSMIEVISFLAIALVGVALLWAKASRLSSLVIPQSPHTHHEHCHHHPDDHDHAGHSHAPISDHRAGLKGMVAAIIAAGMRPCSGSLLVLVLALSQGNFGIGILAALAIGLGTAITTSGLAVFAILAKGSAMRLLQHHFNASALRVITSLEVLAAALVFALGFSLLVASLSGFITTG